tara:strand:- start:105 stop:284 length:180 start_codon:yes stop_codon:yes gene_type:complete
MNRPTMHSHFEWLKGVAEKHEVNEDDDEGKAILKRVQFHTHQAMLELMRLIALKKRSQK